MGRACVRPEIFVADFKIEAASVAIFALTGSPKSPHIKRCSSEELCESHLARTSSNPVAYSSALWWAWVRARRTSACKRSKTSKRSNALFGRLRYLLRLVDVPSVVSKDFSCSSARTFLSNWTNRSPAWHKGQKGESDLSANTETKWTSATNDKRKSEFAGEITRNHGIQSTMSSPTKLKRDLEQTSI